MYVHKWYWSLISQGSQKIWSHWIPKVNGRAFLCAFPVYWPLNALYSICHIHKKHSYIDGRGANCSSGATWGVSISLKDDMQTGGQGFEPATFWLLLPALPPELESLRSMKGLIHCIRVLPLTRLIQLQEMSQPQSKPRLSVFMCFATERLQT